MYCISCGNKLQDNVAFCPNCGKKQPNEAIEVIPSIEAENVRKGEKYEKTSFSDIVFARKAMSVYLIWALLHVTLLLIFSDGIFDKENSNEGMIDFWPFNYNSYLEDNDITEFVIYVVFLVIILKITSLASGRKIDEIISIGLKKAIRFTKKHIFFWEVEIIKSENGNNIKYKIKPRVLKFWNEFNLMNYTWWILLFPLVAFVNCLYYRKEIGVSLGVLVFFLVPCVVLLFVLRKNK